MLPVGLCCKLEIWMCHPCFALRRSANRQGRDVEKNCGKCGIRHRSKGIFQGLKTTFPTILFNVPSLPIGWASQSKAGVAHSNFKFQTRHQSPVQRDVVEICPSLRAEGLNPRLFSLTTGAASNGVYAGLVQGFTPTSRNSSPAS